jgi:chaperonin GroES
MADNNKNNIDKALEALTGALEIEPTGEEIEINPEKGVDFESDVELLEDGSAEINLDPNAPIDLSQVPHDANLAEYIEDNELSRFASDLLAEFESDRDSRKDWEDTYIKGLDMLGFKYEDRTQPFEGASGVVHPLLAESVTQFQAQAYKELLPPSGPVRTQVVGVETPETNEQAQRVQEFMNYQITEVMQEYDPDMDQLLFYLPLCGSAFKKVYYDGLMKRACAKFVAGEDLVINYMATDLESADRITHIIKTSGNDIRKQQLQGFYRDIELPTGQIDSDDVADKIDELDGAEKNYGSSDEEHTILEMHINADVPGFEDTSGVKLPYIVSIDQYSQEILSIKRNYKEGDPNFMKNHYFVHYKFLPGLGFYGFGLIHMLGGLSRTATSALRQLIDAGTLANLPAGFKARGMRIRDHDEPLQPGEFRDVDVTGQSIKESLMMLPYKEPSAVLFQLLGFAVDAGKSFAAIADMKMGEGNEQNPVGTTLALIERGTKVMSAIHKRLHYAQKIEFKLLAKVFSIYLPPQYPYMVVGGNQMIKQQDFDDRVDILPVSDPNIFSMAQRVTLAQQQLQLANAAPQLHNLREAYRRMYAAMGVDNVESLLLPDPGNPQPMSPAMENAGAMRGKEPKPFPMQDHMSHISAHAEFMFTRMVQINPQLYAMLQAHVSEHISLMASEQMQEKYGPQFQELQQAMQQAQQNPQAAQQLQQQMDQLINQQASDQAKIEAEMTKQLASDEESRISREAQDPLVKLKQQEIDLKAMETQMQMQKDMVFDAEKIDIERDKLEADTTINLMKVAADVNKEDSTEAMALLKENMANTREAMKQKASNNGNRTNKKTTNQA